MFLSYSLRANPLSEEKKTALRAEFTGKLFV